MGRKIVIGLGWKGGKRQPVVCSLCRDAQPSALVPSQTSGNEVPSCAHLSQDIAGHKNRDECSHGECRSDDRMAELHIQPRDEEDAIRVRFLPPDDHVTRLPRVFTMDPEPQQPMDLVVSALPALDGAIISKPRSFEKVPCKYTRSNVQHSTITEDNLGFE